MRLVIGVLGVWVHGRVACGGTCDCNPSKNKLCVTCTGYFTLSLYPLLDQNHLLKKYPLLTPPPHSITPLLPQFFFCLLYIDVVSPLSMQADHRALI